MRDDDNEPDLTPERMAANAAESEMAAKIAPALSPDELCEVMTLADWEFSDAPPALTDHHKRLSDTQESLREMGVIYVDRRRVRLTRRGWRVFFARVFEDMKHLLPPDDLLDDDEAEGEPA